MPSIVQDRNQKIKQTRGFIVIYYALLLSLFFIHQKPPSATAAAVTVTYYNILYDYTHTAAQSKIKILK